MSHIRVLIVDDEPFFRTGVRQYVEQGGREGEFDIEECEPGDDYREIMLRVSDASPDVIIADIGYPTPSGMELCRKVVRTFPAVKVIVLSSSAVEDDNELFEAVKSGAAAYLQSKFCSAEELVSTMRECSRGEYPINELVSKNRNVARRVMSQFQEMARNVREDDDILNPLTNRELHILNLICEGNTNKMIARVLGISEQTIKNHVSAVLRKLHANDRAHAIVVAMRMGLISVDTTQHWGRRRSDIPTEAAISTN